MEIKREKRTVIIIGIVLISVALGISAFSISYSVMRNSTLNPPKDSSIAAENATLHFIYSPICSSCTEPHAEVLEFLTDHPEITFIIYDVTNATEREAAELFLNSEIHTFPTVVIEIDTCKYYINGYHITSENLENIYYFLQNNTQTCEEWTYYREFNLWIPLVTGLLSGLSPCIILITGVFGTSLFANQSKKYFLFSLVGFSLGVLLMYFLIGFLFTFFIDIASALLSGLVMKLIIGIPLILLGLWQCVDAWNENSRLFRTPDKLKKFFKGLSEKNSLISSFLLGSAFTLLKSPCIGGILLSLLFSISQVGLNSQGMVMGSLLLFSLGVLIPILVVFGILRVGVSNEKINGFRIKARPYLRLISGLVIILTTVLSFF